VDLQVDRPRQRRRQRDGGGTEAYAAAASGLQRNHDVLSAALAKHCDREVAGEFAGPDVARERDAAERDHGDEPRA
jgi:hypothetical protein